MGNAWESSCFRRGYKNQWFFNDCSQKYIKTNERLSAQNEISMKTNKKQSNIELRRPGRDLATAWRRAGRYLATAWPGPGRDLVSSWPPGGCAYAALPGLDLRWAIGHKTRSMYGKRMGNAWETHGRHGLAWAGLAWAGLAWAGLAWASLAWPGLACLAWAGLALGGSSMTEFLRRVLYNKYNGISMGIALEPPIKKHTAVR